MSFRKLFHGENHFHGKGRAIARRRSRGLMHDVLPAMVETLEERTLLSAVNPGLSDHGLVFENSDADGGVTEISVTAADNAALSNNAAGSGLFINLDGSGGVLEDLGTISITDATIQNNANAGAQIILKNLHLDTLIVDSTIFANNGTNGNGSGLYIDLTNVTIRNLIITDSANVSDQATANSGASSFSNNQFDGVTIVGRTTDLANPDNINTSINTLELSGNVFADNAANGASLDFDRSTIASFTLDDNEATTNGASGVFVKTNRTDIGLDVGEIENTARVNNNTFDANASHGLAFKAEALDENSNPVVDLAEIEIDGINDNVTQNNGGAGIDVNLGQQATMSATLLRNDFINNAERGFDLTAIDTENSFDIQLGTLTRNALGVYVDANTFDGNTGSAVAIDLGDLDSLLPGDATGTFRVYGNNIENTVASGSLLYEGEGINVRIRGGVTTSNGAAKIIGAIIDGNTINGNDGDGIRFTVTEDSELDSLTIGNLSGQNQTFDVNGVNPGGGNVDTLPGDGNDITNNGGDGISLVRLDSAYVHDVNILDNNITENANGVYVQASNTYNRVANAPAEFPAQLVTQLTFKRNNIQSNTVNGVHFHTEFNAVIKADMRYNRIDGNEVHGIFSTAVENNFSDFENIGGTWIKNAITDNGQNGITIEAVTGTVNPLIIGQDGIDVIDEQSLGNYIAFNGQDGIDIQTKAGRTGTETPYGDRNDVSIINNQIISNGQDALDGSPDPYTAGKGIDIYVNGNQDRRFSIHRNIIEENIGDGIELLDHAGRMSVIAQGNTIQANGGRGVDLLVRGDVRNSASAHVLFGGFGIDDGSTEEVNEDDSNRIANNGLEGFYVVTTAARNQRQDVDAEAALEIAPQGSEANESAIDLVLDVVGNEIRGNGGGRMSELGTPASTFAGTGLVVRVGSNNSGSSYSETPDLTGENPNAAGVGANASGAGNGRTNLRVKNNQFSGNAGDDVTLGTFVSSLPEDTAGNWDTPENDQGFRVTGDYERDPLARLNVVFEGNTGETLDVTRGFGSTDYNQSADVAYNNDESTFKRRIANAFDAEPIPNGPFRNGGGSDPRLVNRVADRPSSLGGLAGAYGGFSGLGSSYGDPHDSGGNTSDEQSGTVTALAEASTDGPIRVTATLASHPGNFFLVSIAGTGTNADGTHFADLISFNSATGEAQFDLYVPVDLGSPVPLDGAGGASSGNLVVHNPGKFYYDGIGPSTIRVENTWDGDPDDPSVDNSFDRDNYFTDTAFAEGINVVPIAWDEVEAGTFSFLTASINDDFDVDEGTGEATLTVTLSEPAPEGGVNIFYQTVDGDAEAGSDYTAQSGSVTIAEGETTGTITIVITPDNVPETNANVEGSESFYVDLTSMSVAGEIVDRRGVITINEPPVVSISDGELVEGDAGTQGMEFTISLEGGRQEAVTVEYSTSDGTAQSTGSEADFEATTDTVTFQEGETSKTIFIPIIGDVEQEDPENFTVGLTVTSIDPDTGGPNATVGDYQGDGSETGTGTILDNDTPLISIEDMTIDENDPDGEMTFTVTLTKAVSEDITVNYATQDQSAQAGLDYTGVTNGSVTIAAGTQSQTFTIQITNDGMVEQTETFVVNLSLPAGEDGAIEDGTAVGTIIDDDISTISVSDASLIERDGGAEDMIFTITREGDATQAITVNYATTGGTAIEGVDFGATTGSVTFAAGETTKEVRVAIIGDTEAEINETFTLDITGFSSSGDVRIGDGTGVGTIIDNENANFIIDDVTVVETDSGTQEMTFTVTLSKEVNNIVTVDYATVDQTASSTGTNPDYVPAIGTLTFNPSETSKTITVTINSDDSFEDTETFLVELSNATPGSTIADSSGQGTILDDDTPTVRIEDVEFVEGDEGDSNQMVFTIQLSGDGTDPVSVTYETQDGTATAADGDYTPISSTTALLTPSDPTITVSVPIVGDVMPEDDEFFFLVITDTSSPGTIRVPDDDGQGTILNDDDPNIAIGDATVTESDGNTTISFDVTLDKPVDGTVTVDYFTQDQTAVAGSDYAGVTSGTVTFDPGETTQTVTITVIGDNVLEETETFLVQLENPTNGVIDDGTGQGTIEDDDTPTITVDDVTRNEGHQDGTVTFTVTLSNSANVPVSVNYETVDGTATAGQDYQATLGTLTFAPGETSKTVTVTVFGDRMVEGNESFTLGLSNPIKGRFGDNLGVATLLEDDTPSITITDDGVLEGGRARFTVRLSKPIVGSAVTVDYLTQSVTASDFSDYTPQSGTLTFLPGETVKTIFVDTREFDGREGTEYFFVNLVNSSNAVIADPQARGAIIDPGAGVGLVVGPRAGFPPLVRVYDATGQNIRYSFFAYDPSYMGGVKIATGDVTGDGVLDIITAPGGNNVRSEIKVWDGASGVMFRRFFAYPPNFQAAFNIASGDVNGDGFDDIIVSIAGGTVSDVRGFDGKTMAPLPAFLAYGRYRGGVRIAVGDVTGDGIAEIITAPGSPGAAADIRVFRASDGRILSQFFAFSPAFTRGSYNIAVGDVNGDNRADVVVAVASGLGPEVRVFNGATPQLISRFYAYAPQFRGGVSIAVGDTNFDGRADIITSPFSGAASYVRVFDGVTTALLALPRRPYVDNFHGGTELAGHLYDANLSNVPTSPDFFFQRLDGQLLADSDVPSLEADQAQELVAAAAGRFRAAGFSQAVIDEVASTKISVADLDGETLAVARGGSIVLDVNAAGWGWFIDETPNLDEEYARDGQDAYRAVAGAAQSKVDLLSVLTHEIAHELGFDDLDPAEHSHSLMTATLAPGVRRVGREQLDELFANAELMDELLSV